jgi:hypothetical protein
MIRKKDNSDISEENGQTGHADIPSNRFVVRGRSLRYHSRGAAIAWNKRRGRITRQYRLPFRLMSVARLTAPTFSQSWGTPERIPV